MSQEIKHRIKQFLYREQSLLDELNALKIQKQNIGREIGKAIVVEGVAEIVSDILDSSIARRYGRKITKSALDKRQKDQIQLLTAHVESRHTTIIRDVIDFLSSISIMKKGMKGFRDVIRLLLNFLKIAQKRAVRRVFRPF